MSRNASKTAPNNVATDVVCEPTRERPADPPSNAGPIAEDGGPSETLPLARCRWCLVQLPTGQKFCLTCCSNCGHPYQPGDQVCNRCRCFLPRNQAARVTGTRSQLVPEDLRMNADELMNGIVSDMGGRDNLTTLEASYIRKIADVEITIRMLIANLANDGLFTAGGRVRDAYGQFLAGIDRFDRLAQRVGLARRARTVAPLDAVRMAVERANSETPQ
jgi:hypothetical protein